MKDSRMDFVGQPVGIHRSSCIHTKVGEVKCIWAAFHQKGESVEQLRSNTRHKTVTLLGKSRPDKNDHRPAVLSGTKGDISLFMIS